MRFPFLGRLGGDCSSSDLLFRYVLSGIDPHSLRRETDTVLGKGFLNPAKHLAPQNELLSRLAHELHADDECALAMAIAFGHWGWIGKIPIGLSTKSVICFRCQLNAHKDGPSITGPM